MKYRKIFSGLLVCVLLLVSCFSFCGCGKKEEKKKSESKYFENLPSEFSDENSPIICVNNLNLEIIKGITMSTGFTFHVLSKEPLDENSVKVNIDIDTPFYLLYQGTTGIEEKFSDVVCLQYNNMDWKYLRELEMSTQEDDYKKFLEIMDEISSEYEKLGTDIFPSFYDNTFYVQFDMDNNLIKDEEFDKVEFIIEDESYMVDIGKVYFHYTYSSTPQSDYGEYNLEFSELGRSGYNILQDKDGLITISAVEAVTDKAVKIKDIKLLNSTDSMTIENVEMNIISDDMTINQSWEPGGEYLIPKDSCINFDFKVKDQDFQNKQNYAVNIYLVIEYEVDGEDYITSTLQTICESRYDSQTLYAIYKDGINMASYFNDYVEN